MNTDIGAGHQHQKYVAYYRVSTDRQGRSGLGLEAQRAAVTLYAHQQSACVLTEFVEMESGRRADRPALALALAECKRNRAILAIAKLDRLARNVAFIANLMDSRVEFVCVDMPNANRLTIHIMAAMAEHEAAMISQRTKAALAAARARGTVLGSYGKVLAAEKGRQAAAFAAQIEPVIRQLEMEGYRTTRAMSDELNRRGIRSATGRKWHIATVHRLRRRLPARRGHLLET